MIKKKKNIKFPTVEEIKKMSKEQLDKFTCLGLSEVCKGLSKYKKTTPTQKKQFLKYAETFRKLGEVKVKKDLKVKKTKKVKTDYEELEEIFVKIEKSFEKWFGKMCPSFEPLCPQCSFWLDFNIFKRKIFKEAFQ